MNRQSTTAATVLFILAGSVLAQCPPERLEPHAFGGDFGFALAMNERHLIIGDRHDWSMCTSRCSNGMAYAYRRDAHGGWVFDQFITPSVPGASYGSAVALDGDRAIITASLDSACGGSGVPYVFEFDGQDWVEAGMLCPPDGRAIHGERLALHGDVALVGKAGEDVLVYGRSGDLWEVTRDLSSPNSPGTRSDFGWSMDIDDDWIVIGAPLESLVAVQHGAVYLYRCGSSGAIQLHQKLVPPDVLRSPRLGESVAIDGATLAVGGVIATRTHSGQGVVYMYELVDARWELRQELTHVNPEAADRFGRSVALDGDHLVVGASTDRTALSGGAAYLFQRGADGLWRQTAELFPDQPAQEYGRTVALADGIAAIGAADTIIAGDDRGAVTLFDLSCLLCRPDLDADGSLTVFDFLTFLNLFDDGDPQADFDGDGELTIFDFLAYQTAFDAGCA